MSTGWRWYEGGEQGNYNSKKTTGGGRVAKDIDTININNRNDNKIIIIIIIIVLLIHRNISYPPFLSYSFFSCCCTRHPPLL